MPGLWSMLYEGTVEQVNPAASGVPATYAVTVPRLNPGNPVAGVEALATTGAAYAVGNRVLIAFLTQYGPMVIIGRYQ